MKKYYFGKMAGLVLAVGMMFGLTSCEDILGEWDSPAKVVVTPTDDGTVKVTVTKTSTGAEIANATLPSEITEKLATLKADIAAKGGEEFVVDIKSTALATEDADQSITVPSVNGAKVKLNFSEAVATAENEPLVVKSESTATESSESKNELTIAMPSNSEGTAPSLNLDMPETTVTIESTDGSTVYLDEITAKTATNTLIVNNANIMHLRLAGGNVRLGKSSTINYLLADYSNQYYDKAKYDDLEVTSKGVTPYKVVDGEKTYFVFQNNQPYYFKKLSVMGSDYSVPVKLYFVNTGGASSTETKPVLDELELYSWPYNAEMLNGSTGREGTTAVEIDNFSRYDNGSSVENTLSNGDYEIKKVTTRKVDDLVKTSSGSREAVDSDYKFYLCFQKVNDGTTNGGYYPFPYIKEYDLLTTLYDPDYNKSNCPMMHGKADIKHYNCGNMQIDVTGRTDIFYTHFQGGGVNEGTVYFNIKQEATGTPVISLTNCMFQRGGCTGRFVVEAGSGITGLTFAIENCRYGNGTDDISAFIMSDGKYRGEALSVPVTIFINNVKYTADANSNVLTKVTE